VVALLLPCQIKGPVMTRTKATNPTKDEWNSFGLRVTDHNVAFDWGFNSAIYDRNRRSDESSVYESSQRLSLDCIVLWPEEQAGDHYHISLSEPLKDWFFGPPKNLHAKLGDFVVTDKQGNPKYRKCKLGEVPIYEPPFQIGLIDKRPGGLSAFVTVQEEILSQMINLVLSKQATYVHLVEVIKPKPEGRRGKNRWVTRISVHLGEEDERDIVLHAKPS